MDKLMDQLNSTFLTRYEGEFILIPNEGFLNKYTIRYTYPGKQLRVATIDKRVDFIFVYPDLCRFKEFETLRLNTGIKTFDELLDHLGKHYRGEIGGVYG